MDVQNSKRRMSQPYPDQERRTSDPRLDVEPVELTRKYADAINGIDLVGHEVGDRLPLNRHDARLIVAEGWARPVPQEQRRHAEDREESRSHRSRRGRTV